MAAKDRPADVQFLVSDDTEQITGYMARGREQKFPAAAIDDVLIPVRNPTTGATEIVGPDGVINSLFDPSTPVLIIGGDHPYQQWLGDSSHGGTLDIYEAHGIKPYIASNTNSEAAQNPGDDGYLSWSALSSISSRAELMSHGARHLQAWTKANTGLKITYSGANATATVGCDGTNLVLTDSGATNIALASKTLTQLQAAINAVSGWSCTLAPELVGTERATTVLKIQGSSKNAKSPLVARIACGGGIIIRYTGSVYKSTRVWKTGTALRLYGDGVCIASIGLTNTSYDTYAELVAYINTLTGWTAVMCDNDNSVSANSDNYISGVEATTSLLDATFLDCNNQEVVLSAGLTNRYMIRRMMQKAKETAAANGVTFKNFAQSGGYFYKFLSDAFIAEHPIMRGNSYYKQRAPYPFQPSKAGHFISHIGMKDTEGYTSAGRCEAIIDALADSPGWGVNLLIHLVGVDGSSGVSLLSGPAGDGKIPETYWMAMLTKIKSKIDAGAIRTLTHEEYRKQSPSIAKPGNLLFNPRLKNSGETLVGAGNDAGYIIPGWALTAPAALTSLSITDDGLSLVSDNATTISMLRQDVDLSPGKSYRVRLNVDEMTISSGNGIGLSLQRAVNSQAMKSAALPPVIYTPYLSQVGGGEFRVTIPQSDVLPAFVRGIAGPFDLSTNYNIKVNINGKGLTADINCRGSTPAATTAKEVAAAINAALAADSRYPAEYHNCARSEYGMVVIEQPYEYAGSLPQSFVTTVARGSTLDAFTAIMGSAVTQDAVAYGSISTLLPEESSIWTLSVLVQMVGSATISGIALQEC